MSIVKNGRVCVSDQSVDYDRYDKNYDEIKWKSKGNGSERGNKRLQRGKDA